MTRLVSALRLGLAACLALCATTLAARAAQDAPARPEAPPATAPLRIGVTLHPYYSWVANIVRDVPGIELRGVIPGEVDAGSYQPSPEDIRHLADLDVLVVNGAGHDDFIAAMLAASGNTRAVVIHVNDETPLIRAVNGGAANSHSFISFSNAIQQTDFIARKLGELRPGDAEAFQVNAAAYARRLRALKADAATKLADARITRVVTVHDGYSYLLQELGLEVVGVVEPAHGLVPSAQELAGLIDLVRREQVRVVLSEASFPDELLEVLRKETGVKVYLISHVAVGAWTPDQFEREMAANTATLIQALVTDAG